MGQSPMFSGSVRNKLALAEYEEILEYGQRNPEASVASSGASGLTFPSPIGGGG